ncbi:hypothetical protein JXA48_00225 [Candidatus Woesearchaeota archaeon]|nr:hypothetical protein [Candidatus Woesearchaeota archaeon]
MVNPDLFESYLNLRLPKDLSFVSSFSLRSKDKTKTLSDLAQYTVIKQRVQDFSSDSALVRLYSQNPLNYINSEILKKDISLSQDINSIIQQIKNSVNDYAGSNSRKIVEVESDLEFITLANAFIDSDVDVDYLKEKIRSKLYSKIKRNNRKTSRFNFNYKNLIYGFLLVGGMYVGHSVFPKEKRMYTTIDKDIYENPSIPLEKKMNQFVYDRNLLLKYEYDLVQNLVNENNKLKGD